MKDLIKFLFQKGQHHPRRGSRNFSREGYNLKKNHVFSLYKCVYKHKSNAIYKMYSCFSFFPSVFYLKGCNLNTPASSKFADAFYLFEIFGYDLQMSGCSFLSNISLHSCYPDIQYINSMALFHSLFLLFKNPPLPLLNSLMILIPFKSKFTEYTWFVDKPNVYTYKIKIEIVYY